MRKDTVKEIEDIIKLLYPKKITNRSYCQEVKQKFVLEDFREYVKRNISLQETKILFIMLKQLNSIRTVTTNYGQIIESKNILVLLPNKIRSKFQIMKYVPLLGYITHTAQNRLETIAELAFLIEARKAQLAKKISDKNSAR